MHGFDNKIALQVQGIFATSSNLNDVNTEYQLCIRLIVNVYHDQPTLADQGLRSSSNCFIHSVSTCYSTL